jgi:putative membrane protein
MSRAAPPKDLHKTSLKGVSIFTCSYLFAAALLTMYTRNWEFLLYTSVVFTFALCALEVHRHIPLKPSMLWSLSIWGLMHMMGGLVPVPVTWTIDGTKHVLYSLWLIPYVLRYDNLVHGFGFAAITWAFWHLLRIRVKAQRPTIGLLALCMLAGMGLGALNEIVEFIATLSFASTNVGGYANTCEDLIANFAGALVTACLIRTFDNGKVPNVKMTEWKL